MRIFLNILRYSFVVVLTSLVIACGNNQVVILQGLDQDSANQVMVTLGANNIGSSKLLEKAGTYSILVKEKHSIDALSVLQNNGLPNKPTTSLGEEFKKDGFISSPLEEQSRFIYALEAQISSMISMIDGVNNVSVQITLPLPNDNMLQSDVIKPSASVLIKYKAGYHLEMYSTRIKQLVANSVPGLIPDHVELLFVSQEEVN